MLGCEERDSDREMRGLLRRSGTRGTGASAQGPQKGQKNTRAVWMMEKCDVFYVFCVWQHQYNVFCRPQGRLQFNDGEGWPVKGK